MRPIRIVAEHTSSSSRKAVGEAQIIRDNSEGRGQCPRTHGQFLRNRPPTLSGGDQSSSKGESHLPAERGGPVAQPPSIHKSRGREEQYPFTPIRKCANPLTPEPSPEANHVRPSAPIARPSSARLPTTAMSSVSPSRPHQRGPSVRPFSLDRLFGCWSDFTRVLRIR